MMFISKWALSLSGIFSGLTSLVRQVAVPERSLRHMIIHRSNDFFMFEDAKVTANIPLNSTHNVTIASLTPTEAQNLQSTGYAVQTDVPIQSEFIRDNRVSFFPLLADISEDATDQEAAASPYLQAPMLCKTCSPIDTSIVLLDTVIYPAGIPKGMIFQQSPPFTSSGDKPCNTHGTTILNEMGKSITNKYLNVTSVPVFSCGGSQNYADAVLAVNWARENVVKPNIALGRHTEFSYSWGVIYSEALNAIIQDVINLGTLFVKSASNSNIYVCPLLKYEGGMLIGGTNTKKKKNGEREPGDQIGWCSSYGKLENPCVDPFLPAWVDTYPSGVDMGCGTSWGPPLAVAQGACFWQANPEANAQQIATALKTNGRVISPTPPPLYPDRPSYPPYTVKLKATLCDKPKIIPDEVPNTLFNSLKTYDTTNFVEYATKQQRGLCANYSIATSNGASLTYYRNTIGKKGTITVSATIGAKQATSNKYRHSLSVNGREISYTETASRIIGAVPVSVRTVQNNGIFAVMYQNAQQKWVDLLSTPLPYNVSVIGFAGKDLTYRNAMTCSLN